jgi:hypothetical protein
VRRILAAGLEKNRYTIFNDLRLPLGGGTVHIDHLVVSRNGIFVIESQYARGWVTGTPVQDRWKHSWLNRTSRFDNPVHVNRQQTLAVQQSLNCPATAVHGLVVVAGHKGFKSEMPENVLAPEKLIRAIRKRGQPVLTPEQASKASRLIDSERLKMDAGRGFNRLALVQFVLLASLAIGLYLAYGDDIARIYSEFRQSQEREASPEQFHPDGSRKSEIEMWEDSLRCAWSSDTGRCACYEPGGKRADLATERCRELAERGSILKNGNDLDQP